MTTHTQTELLDRLNLMEQIIQDGRRTTSFYGWLFVLWGVAYLAALGWAAYLPAPAFAWPVTMTAAALAGGLIIARKRRGQPVTIKTRALGAIWTATGTTIFLFAFASVGSPNGWSHPQTMMAGIELLLGLANMASSLTLRWKAQAAVALLWWACGITSLYVSSERLVPVYLIGTVFGNLVFGVYLMILESKARRQDRALDLGDQPGQVAHG